MSSETVMAILTWRDENRRGGSSEDEDAEEIMEQGLPFDTDGESIEHKTP